MTTFARALLFVAALLAPQIQTHAFVAPQGSISAARIHTVPSTTLNVFLSPEWHDPVTLSTALDSSSHLLLSQEIDREAARGDFYFYFLLGSGAGGIGLAQLPRIYAELSGIRALSGTGPSEGGEAVNVGLSSLFYPTMFQKDVAKAIAKVPTADAIRKQGTCTSYLASKGYIDRDDFILSLKQCNPLASYALFEALSGGGAGSVSPEELEDNLAKYRATGDPVAAFAADLQASTIKKLGAYGAFAFLLVIVWGPIIGSGVSGFL